MIFSPMKNATLILLLASLMLAGCLRPEPTEPDTRVIITLEKEIDTRGWSRDVMVEGDYLFVAASQAGAQIWDMAGDEPQMLWDTLITDKVAELIRYDAVNNIVFIADDGAVHYLLMNTTLTDVDTAYYNNPWLAIFDPKIFSDGNTEDMALLEAEDGRIVVLVTDRDFSDGLKRTTLNFNYDVGFDLNYWEPTGNKLVSGHLRGLDVVGDIVATGWEELGAGLHRVTPVQVDSLAHRDTPGDVLDVTFYGEYLLAAADWGGLQIMTWDTTQLDLVASLDLEETVKHIAVWEDLAVLSCGNDECYIVDLSDPLEPEFDQFLPTGYCYRTFVQDDHIYAATREGVKIYSIERR